jgi:RNA recognition motif-containing protein
MNKTLYVDNLNLATTERDLVDLFAQHGHVEDTTLSIDPDSGRSRGFGFVTMATPAAAQSAIRALNGKAIGTCTLSVSEAWPHESRQNRKRIEDS